MRKEKSHLINDGSSKTAEICLKMVNVGSYGQNDTLTDAVTAYLHACTGLDKPGMSKTVIQIDSDIATHL